MKKIIILIGLIATLFLLVGCAKDITETGARNIAQQYMVNELRTEEPVVINQVFLSNDGWHVQLTVGDDKGTVIIDKKGKVKGLETYKWI
jgi:hypothetical protein